MEVRTYTMQPGARADFVQYFDTEAIPRMRAAGMTVLGQWSSVTDPNVFAYARTFDSIEQREQQYRAFYESEDWLGWMIDVAIGKEESFLVFLGDSEPEPELARGPVSGVHAERFTLASGRGVVAEVTDAAITVRDDDGTRTEFAVHPEAKVWFTPNGRGTGRAVEISLAELAVNDTVLVLGAVTDSRAVARQVVKRPRAG